MEKWGNHQWTYTHERGGEGRREGGVGISDHKTYAKGKIHIVRLFVMVVIKEESKTGKPY